MLKRTACWLLLMVVGSMVGCSAQKPETARAAEAPGGSAQIVSADLAAGRAIYDANCGSCHRLGDYDPQGRGNLARRSISASFLAEHHGEGLSAEDVADLRAFISAP